MSAIANQALYTQLKELKIIDDTVLSQAFKQAQTEKNDLSELLLKKGLISSDNLGRLIADQLNLPFVDLNEIGVTDEILKIIPENFARQHNILAYQENKTQVYVATNEPENKIILELIARKTGKQVIVNFAVKQEIQEALLNYKRNPAQLFKKVIETNVVQAKGSQVTEPPIIAIVDTIISYANEKKASDIHLEPTKTHSLVRFRIDGVLHDIVKLPVELHPRLVTRIKVMSKLRTDEHQAAQDGKLQLKPIDFTQSELDIRVSIVPSTEGEKIVMRLLSERSRRMSLEDLGFSTQALKIIENAYHEPHGMILSTGPTGSGKTTTMYSILKLLNKREVNISTIEDPVEYEINGVTQIQVNPKTELTFAKGLRSIVRQDPDIILVGEIRDNETADIAINAAMTGHLVLSTLHTNDAATTIPRLIDMEVEPFLIASTINIIIAQRLVRKIHLQCRVSEVIKRSQVEKTFDSETLDKIFGDQQSIRTYRGEGCNICNQTGYEGRIGIYEVLQVTDEIKAAIITKKPAEEINQLALKAGMQSMFSDGLEKVKAGITSLAEILRATKE